MTRKTFITAAILSFGLIIVGCQDQITSPDANVSDEVTAQDGNAVVKAGKSAQHARVITVRPNKMGGWSFIDEGAGGGYGSLVKGPANPPFAAGSVEFKLTSSGDAWTIQNFDEDFIGLRLDKITDLSYCTYVSQASGVQAPALQLNFDDDVTDADESWKGRLVFEPANNQDQQSVTQNTWQCWDADEGQWWSSSGLFGSPAQAIANNLTLDEILAQFPDAGINSKFGGILLKAGSGWSGGFLGNADNLTLGIEDEKTRTYNFEGQPEQARGPK